MSHHAAVYEAERLRAVDSDRVDDATRHPHRPRPAGPALLAVTTRVSTYPTVAQAFYSVVPLAVLGAQVEGGTATVTAGPAPFLALNLGSVVPPQGTTVECEYVGGRWVFRYEGGSGNLQVTTAESPSASLNVKVAAGNFTNAANAVQSYAGTASFGLTANATNYVYLTDGGVLTASTSAYPAGVVRLATVVTGASAVTSIQSDDRTFKVCCTET